jgi:DNA-binding MarR family transcriptional regulator
MALDQAELAYLEYIRKQGGGYVPDELTRHYLGSQLGLSPTKFQEAHQKLVQQGLISVSAGGDPFNSSKSSLRVSITSIGEAALKRPKPAISARKRVWWNPWTWRS